MVYRDLMNVNREAAWSVQSDCLTSIALYFDVPFLEFLYSIYTQRRMQWFLAQFSIKKSPNTWKNET